MVGLDAELPLLVVLFGEDRDAGVGARGVVGLNDSGDDWARGLRGSRSRRGRGAHNR